MTIVAHTHPYVVGVDTHARTHTFAILAAPTGELIATGQFPATTAGMDRAIARAARCTNADLAALWVIEGVATYGARLAASASQAGYEVSKPPGWTHVPTAERVSPTRSMPAVSPRSCPSSPPSFAALDATTGSGLRCGSWSPLAST